MPRTVEKILKEDETKALPTVDEDVLIEGEDGVVNEGPTPEEIAADLREQLVKANQRADEEAAKRREADAKASTASAAAGTAVQSQIVAHETAIVSKISNAKTKLESIKSELRQAKAAGDVDAEVELQDALNSVRYELNTAEWEQKQFATWKEQQKTAPVSETSRSPYTAKEQAWIESHPEFSKNKKFASSAKIAASDALEEGLKQDSPAYFQYIEDVLTQHGLLTAAEEPLSGAATNTASSSVAAAPSRTGGSNAAPAVNKNSKYPYIQKGFTIPADWVQAAKDQGFDDVREYANMRLEDEAKGQGR